MAALVVIAFGPLAPSAVRVAQAAGCGSAAAVNLDLNNANSIWQNIPATNQGVQPPVAQAGNVMSVNLANTSAGCTVTASIGNDGVLTFPAGTLLAPGDYNVTTNNTIAPTITNACAIGRDSTGAVTDPTLIAYCAQVASSNATFINVQCAVNGVDLLGTPFGTTFTLTANPNGTFTESLSGQQKCGGRVNGITASALSVQGAFVTPLDSTGTATPELGSGELVAAGLLPLGLVLAWRRRRAGRAAQH